MKGKEGPKYKTSRKAENIRAYHYRSSRQHKRTRDTKLVLDICALEGSEETKDDIISIPLLVPQVPQQINDWECGYFVLYFMYRFMQSAPNSLTQSKFLYFVIFVYINFTLSILLILLKSRLKPSILPFSLLVRCLVEQIFFHFLLN